MAQHRAAGLRDEGAVVAGEDHGVDPERRRGAARRLQRAAGDDGEESAGADELRERLAGAGHGPALVVEQRAVEVAGEQERLAAAS